MTSTPPKLPREITAGGSSVAIIARTIGPATLAHRPLAQTRDVASNVSLNRPARQVTSHITACAADDAANADEAYLISAAWADHKGAAACTEPACFPTA